MRKLLTLLTILHMLASAAFGIDVKIINVQNEYKLSKADAGYLLAMTFPTKKVIKIVVPSERSSVNMMPAGAVITGVAMSNGTLEIVPENDGVMILQADNAYRTRSQGSTWTLKRIGRGFWILEGDLYSLEVDAYVGEDVTIRATVDPSATGPLNFTWYKNNIVLLGKTQAALKLPNVTTADSGNYKVDAYNSAGIVKSETTNLMVR